MITPTTGIRNGGRGPCGTAVPFTGNGTADSIDFIPTDGQWQMSFFTTATRAGTWQAFFVDEAGNETGLFNTVRTVTANQRDGASIPVSGERFRVRFTDTSGSAGNVSFEMAEGR